MRSFLCAKISLAMCLDGICPQSTVNSPFSRSIFNFPFILLISTGREQKSWLFTRQRVRGHIIPLGLGQSPDFLCSFHSHCGAKASLCQTSRANTLPPRVVLSGSALWRRSIPFRNFEITGLDSWTDLCWQGYKSHGLWGFPFSGLWLQWGSLYGDYLSCALHCVRQSRTCEAQAQSREPTLLSFLKSGPYSVSLLSTVQTLLHMHSITVWLFLRTCGKKDAYSSQMGFSGPRKVFCPGLFGKPVRLLGLNDKAWERCQL